MSLFVKDPFKLLIETATDDIQADTAEQIECDSIMSSYNDLEECDDTINTTAEMVTVIKVNDDYFTEMNYLVPYMNDNNIKSVIEALNDVAAANGLDQNQVGLLVDSQDDIDDMVEVAVAKGKKSKDSVYNKLGKAKKLFDKLKSNGIKVKKKKKKNPNKK